MALSISLLTLTRAAKRRDIALGALRKIRFNASNLNLPMRLGTALPIEISLIGKNGAAVIARNGLSYGHQCKRSG